MSPDGNWMWDGSDWIPAPPKSDVLPSSAINQNQIQSFAESSGVMPSQLNSVAPYFDQNRDGILQQNELHQAAMSISNPPVSPAPQQQPMMQQPMMQQPMMQQPMMQQPMVQQPMIQQQPMTQPVRQQVVIVKQEKSSNKIIPWIGVALIIFSIFMPYISILGFDVTGADMISFMGDSPFAEESEEGCLDSYGNEVDCDDTDDDSSSSSDMESDELALVIAMFMLFFSPLVFLVVAVISAIILLVGGSSRVMGTLHITYAIIFVICGLLSPTALGISIFDFIGFGFYMGAFAGLFLVVE